MSLSSCFGGRRYNRCAFDIDLNLSGGVGTECVVCNYKGYVMGTQMDDGESLGFQLLLHS